MNRGKYFYIKEVDKTKMRTDVGLDVLRTYNVCLTSLESGLCVQVDVGSRLLHSNNFLETLNKTPKQEWNSFTGEVVMANYGNHRTYKIDGIDTNMTPIKEFYSMSKAGKISYIDYYQDTYQLKIYSKTQPLIRTKITEKKHVDGKLEKVEK